MKKIIQGSGGKSGSGSGRVAVESPDSLRSQQFARVLDMVSEGEIGGLVDGLKSVYLDDTPLQNADGTFNFEGVTIETRNGTQVQSYIPGFGATETEVGVGVEVKNSLSVTRTVTNMNTDAARVTVSVPQLTDQDTTNGDLRGSSVEIAIDVQANGGGFVPTPIASSWTRLATAANPYAQAVQSQGIGITLGWAPPQIPDGSGGTYPDPSAGISWRVDYRLVGSPTWNVLRAGTFSGSSPTSSTSPYAVPFAIIATWAYIKTWSQDVYSDSLPLGLYEVRHVVVSGTGTLSSSAVYSRTDRLTDTITGKTVSRYQRNYVIPLTGTGPWDIRVRRVTADSTSAAINNKTFWDSYTEIVNQKLTYPNSALVGLSVDASQFQSVPRRGYDMLLLKVLAPSNYDPITRVYTGPWDGELVVMWTDNPAWCWYDMVTSERYGLGEFIDASQVDKWAMYTIGKYCDEMVPDGYGGVEPRFTCNLYLQAQAEAFSVVNSMASIFRGMAYWASGSITATQDAPSDPVALFTSANVIDGVFNYSGSGLNTRHTVALVTWNDPNNAYMQAVEYVEDHEGIARYGVRQTEFVAVGCTSRGQAHRIGRWLLYTERLETEVNSFGVGIDGAVVYPGAIIKTQDTQRSGVRHGGRVIWASEWVVQVDSRMTIEAGTVYTLNVVLPDGSIETRGITNSPGAGQQYLVMNAALTAIPQQHSVWVMEASTLSLELWRVISLAERDKTSIDVTAVKHYPEKYGLVEYGIEFEIPTTTAINLVPVPPTGIAVVESIYLNGSGVSTMMTVSWENSNLPQIRGYVVRYKDSAGNWTETSEVPETALDIENVTDGDTYTVRVHSVNALGARSPGYAEATHTVVGKAWPPADVASMTATQQPDRVVLSWPAVADVDLADYEIRRGTVWGSSTFLGRTKSTTLKLLPMLAGSYTWLIKAVDTSGNYSTAAASGALSVAAPEAVTLTHALSGKDYILTWSTPASGFDIAHYEVRQGPDAGNTELVTKTNSLSFKAPADWVGSRTFYVRAVDLGGNAAALASTAITVGAPGAPSLQASVVMAKVQLEWSTPVTSLPIAEYEVRHGASWVAGLAVGRITGNSLRVSISWTGARTFWVAAIDLNGNTGAAGSASVSISVPSAPAVSGAFNIDQAVLTWTEPSASLPIEEYEIGYGATSVGRVKGTTLTHKVNWVGDRTFWVKAYDVNGNAGAEGSTSMIVTAPSAPAITQQTVDNNVLLYWTGSMGTLPIQTYELRKGATWAAATLIGQKSGGFTTVFETVSAAYTYWVAGIDSAGNYGTAASVVATVNQPPDYVLLADYNTAFPGTKSNAYLESGTLLLPIDTAESWETHFTSNAWTTPQQQVDASYPVYVQPGNLTGYYEEVVDYVTTLAGAKVSVTPNAETITGIPTISCTISTSLNGTDWTEHTNTWQVFATNFRYSKVRVTVTGDALTVCHLHALNIKLDVKLKNDAGSASVVSTDVGGTQVNFSVDFIDISSITVTPGGTAARIAVYDYTDVPDPTGFKILLFDTSGVRQSGTVSWSAKGY